MIYIHYIPFLLIDHFELILTHVKKRNLVFRARFLLNVFELKALLEEFFDVK